MTHRLLTALRVPPEALDEYRRRHEEMDAEVRASIAANGGRNLSIFAAPEWECVVMYVEVDDLDAWNRAASSDTTRRWWAHMAEVMPTHPDLSPIATDLNLIFHLDDAG